MAEDAAGDVHGSSRPYHQAPAARRARRADVEQALIFAERGYAERLAAKHGVSIRTIRQDAKLVMRRWLAEDKRQSKHRRSQAVRRYERFQRMALNGNPGAEAAARIQARIDKILGLEAPNGGAGGSADQNTIDIEIV